MSTRHLAVKTVTLLLGLVFSIEIGWAQEQVPASKDLRIRLKSFTFNPLDSLPTITQELRLEMPSDDPAYCIIQFQRPLRRQEIKLLQDRYHLEFKHYIPDQAYLEKVTQSQIDTLKKLEYFRWSGLYQPAYKIDPEIGLLKFRTAERQAMPGLLLRAILFPEADTTQVVQILTRVGASAIKVLDDRKIGGVARVQFSLPRRDLMPQIARSKEVRWIEEVAEMIEDNVGTAGTIQSGTPGTEPIWNQGLHGEGQIIGILDSGPLDIDHCFFMDPVNNVPGVGHRKVLSIRNARGSAAGGHATFVSGNAAGDDFNNLGTNNWRGGAWGSRLVSGNRLDIFFGLSTMLAELTAAANTGATIHSNSWHDNTAGAGNPATYNQTAADVDNFLWRNEDHIVLGSAGNNGEEQGPPGTAKNAICVGASLADPNEMNFGDGNPGPTADGRRKPDLMTPGCNIQSATVNTPCGTGPRAACATSYATTNTAAVAALIRQYYTEGWYPSGTRKASDAFVPSGALIKATVLNSTVDMAGIAGYPGNQEGWGLLRLDNALIFLDADQDLWVSDVRHANGLITGDSHDYSVVVSSTTVPLKITLVWTEPPGAAGSANPVVNDLDLVVTSPDGATTFLGNFFAGGQSISGGTADNLNNVEVVFLNGPQLGEYRIEVNGTQINVGNPRQGYAVVATADMPVWEYEYAAKVICGTQKSSKELHLARGRYSTTINIHNPSDSSVVFFKKLALTFPPKQQKPGQIIPIATDVLGPDEALKVDCVEIDNLIQGNLGHQFIEGFLVIKSMKSLDVSAVYTIAKPTKFLFWSSYKATSVDVEQIQERQIRKREHTHLGPIPLADLVSTGSFTVDPGQTFAALTVPNNKIFVLTDVITFPLVQSSSQGFVVRYRVEENNLTKFQYNTVGTNTNWSQHFTGGIKFMGGSTVNVVNTTFSSGSTAFQLLGYLSPL